jgi:hypothetical protein
LESSPRNESNDESEQSLALSQWKLAIQIRPVRYRPPGHEEHKAGMIAQDRLAAEIAVKALGFEV